MLKHYRGGSPWNVLLHKIIRQNVTGGSVIQWFLHHIYQVSLKGSGRLMTSLYREQGSRMGRLEIQAFLLSENSIDFAIYVRFWQTRYVTPLFRTFCVEWYHSFCAISLLNALKQASKSALKLSGIAQETGIFTFFFFYIFFINIWINPESINPRLPCDLYEPWTCIFHPLTPMAIQAHPEGSGLHIKCQFQDILTLQCRVRMWAVIPDGHDIYW